jgi:hypothetical protein
MSAHIVNAKKISEGFDVIFTSPKKNKDTQQLSVAMLDSKTKKPFYFETPELIPPFGLSVYDPLKTGADPTKFVYSMPLCVEFIRGEAIPQDLDEEKAKRIQEQQLFMSALENINEKLLTYGIENSQFIFKKVYQNTDAGRASFKEFVFSTPIKQSSQTDPKTNEILRHYADRINLKIPANKEFTGPDSRILFFKDSVDPIAVKDWDHLQQIIPKNRPVKAILQPRIFATPQKFGLTFKIVQVKLSEYERVGRPETYAFSVKPKGFIENKTENENDDTKVDDSDNEADNVDVEEN